MAVGNVRMLWHDDIMCLRQNAPTRVRSSNCEHNDVHLITNILGNWTGQATQAGRHRRQAGVSAHSEAGLSLGPTQNSPLTLNPEHRPASPVAAASGGLTRIYSVAFCALLQDRLYFGSPA